MSGINRYFSRRDKGKSAHSKPPSPSSNLRKLFTEDGSQKSPKPEKDLEKKTKIVKDLLTEDGLTSFKTEDIEYVLNSPYASGSPTKAHELLNLVEESEEGIVVQYNPKLKLLGAVNRNAVSCYLDSILFGMFAHLDSFEAMLYNHFADDDRKRLGALLRLWVNTLRSGKLVTTNITRQLQETLSSCGWKEAAGPRQQDASEAFSFITEKLELPMLTLKMDIFHTGKEDAKDDHKLVRERLLDVAIPEKVPEGTVITLEDCLEMYFNSRIEVKRYLERRSTQQGSIKGRHDSLDCEKPGAMHIENVEDVEDADDEDEDEDEEDKDSSFSPSYSAGTQVIVPSRSTRNRAKSIIQQSYVYEKNDKLLEAGITDGVEIGDACVRQRSMSLRKEVLMPAWQFFSLIPWYTTDEQPNSDAQVAAHFSSKRPVLGICLKRYYMKENGTAGRRGTHIDIPTEIGLPHFIHDDSDKETGFGNFQLSLQSVVCHRGSSVHSGHYVSLARVRTEDGAEVWKLFDDLNEKERIREVDINKALSDECPYLLFYQVMPIDGDPGNIEDNARPPPSYTARVDEGTAIPSPSTNARSSSEEAASTSRREVYARGRSPPPQPPQPPQPPPQPLPSAPTRDGRRPSTATTNASTASLENKSADAAILDSSVGGSTAGVDTSDSSAEATSTKKGAGASIAGAIGGRGRGAGAGAVTPTSAATSGSTAKLTHREGRIPRSRNGSTDNGGGGGSSKRMSGTFGRLAGKLSGALGKSDPGAAVIIDPDDSNDYPPHHHVLSLQELKAEKERERHLEKEREKEERGRDKEKDKDKEKGKGKEKERSKKNPGLAEVVAAAAENHLRSRREQLREKSREKSRARSRAGGGGDAGGGAGSSKEKEKEKKSAGLDRECVLM